MGAILVSRCTLNRGGITVKLDREISFLVIVLESAITLVKRIVLFLFNALLTHLLLVLNLAQTCTENGAMERLTELWLPLR